jgi:DNA-binding beta-propeller fold protein YncE
LTTAGDNLVVTLYNRHIVSFVKDAGMGGFNYVQFAGTDNMAGYNDGQRDEARFNHPLGVTTDDKGYFYVADRNNHLIRQINPDNDRVGSFGIDNTPGYEDGFSNPHYNEPVFIRWIPNPPDCCGILYVSEDGNHTIRGIVVDGGSVFTLAGNGEPGFIDGTGDEAQFNSPRGIDFDEEGNLFVADFMNNAIRKITPEGVVTTVIKSEGVVSINEGSRLVDGPAGTAQFNGPYGIAVGSDGSLYFSDLYSYAIRKVTFE